MKPRDHLDAVIAQWKAERPEIDLSPVEIIGRTGRIMAFVDRALEDKFEEFGISRAAWDVIAALRRNGTPYRMTQRELMRSLLRTSGGMSLRIDALERQGLVRREQDKSDRRSTFIVLTPKGSGLIEAVIPHHLDNESRLIAGLSPTDRVQLTSLLRKWLTSLESTAPNGPHAFIGLVLLDFRASMMKRRAVGLPDVPGLLVHAVEAASQAETAGFRKGDLICSVQGEPIASLAELRRALNKQKPRTKQLVVMRGSDSVRLDLLAPR